MMYALGIIMAALAVHAIYKYQEIAGAGNDPLDEAKLINSIERSTKRNLNVATAGGDGRAGTADAAVSVQTPTESRLENSTEFGEEYSEDKESWVADIRFTDEEGDA